MAIFLRPKHVQHLRHPARHLRGRPAHERNGHGYDFALNKRAKVPNGLFLRILRAGAQGEPFQWPFFCVQSMSGIFVILLGIYEATRPMK